MDRKRKSEKRLDALYAILPDIECKELCQKGCGPIAMIPDEFRRISEISGTIPTVDNTGTCSLLINGRCSVYEVRPAVCRLFGIAKEMKCPFGCVPTKYMTKEESHQFLRKIDKATGRKGVKATMNGLEDFLK
jgi:Fe-S-cluster containining protein